LKAKKRASGPDKKLLETIGYEYPGKKITIETESGEFTCLCPWTGQPDFATIRVSYVPARKCVELKSLKLYLQSYRNAGMVHESVVNSILEDLAQITDPLKMRVAAEFNIRGGIKTTVSREYVRKKGGR